MCFYNYKSYGYIHSEETNKKISLSNKGKKLSEEIRKKIRNRIFKSKSHLKDYIGGNKYEGTKKKKKRK